MLKIIGGKFKNRNIATPKGFTTRPTSSLLRGAIFNMLQHTIENKKFLDVCAGSGAIGIEALSRGASEATFIEKDRTACQCIRNNILLLDLQSQVICSDAIPALIRLSSQNQTYDFIYIDPPYDAKAHLYGQNISLGLAVLHLIDKHNLLNVNGLVLLEGTAKLSDEQFSLNQLTLVETRHYGNTFLSIFSSKSDY